MPDDHRRNDPDPLKVPEAREFRAAQDFLRAARNFMEGPLAVRMAADYQAAIAQTGAKPAARADAEAVLDGQGSFQLYSWLFRHLQRFKYEKSELSIGPTVAAAAAEVTRRLNDAAARAGDQLRLNPSLPLPDYYAMVDFHQHPGGVAHDDLDGVMYEMARRTTVPSHLDPNGIYRLLFSELPEGRRFPRVLDWGCGHGAGLMTWLDREPLAEAYGVDLSAPCLKLAHLRAREAGKQAFFSQQDLARLDFADGFFDLIFHMFMFHEIPPAAHPAVLAEARRVLKPGGLMLGAEFHLRENDPYQNAIQVSHAWLNNETYAAAWYQLPVEKIAADAGFSKVTIRPFNAMLQSQPGVNRTSTADWRIYLFEA